MNSQLEEKNLRSTHLRRRQRRLTGQVCPAPEQGSTVFYGSWLADRQNAYGLPKPGENIPNTS